MCKLLVFIILVGLKAGAAVSEQISQQYFSAHLVRDGSGYVRVQKEIWLRTVPPYFTLNGKKYNAEDGGLKLIGHSTRNGRDIHGLWESQDFHYTADGVPIRTSTKHYFNRSMIIFEQYFPEGAENTEIDSVNQALSGFPRFVVGGQSPGVHLGYLDYGGMFVGDTTRWMARWTNTTMNLRDGLPGGPLVLFDKQGRVIIISAYNNFMASINQHESICGGILSYGIMGRVKSIPKDYSVQTILYYGDHGINMAFEGWGHVMRTQYGRHDNYVKSDFAVNYLGYYTDNGAYYYYLTEKNKTYSQTIYDVQNYAKSLKIPYRYVQYDSWWYSMGPMGGVTKWESRPSIFPEGMVAVKNRTGWPVVAHNRWWSSATPYSTKNGGQFQFMTENFKAVPMDINFWHWLFKKSKKWGLITYEQDWLDVQLLGMTSLQTDVHSARTWLMLMGKAAEMNDINIQYCMSFSRHALQALEIPRVTQIRVTDDYQPGENDWKLAVSSIFAHALRIAPYKDSFWTTQVQPGNPYNLSETHPALHALSSVLSTGPVGPADCIGKTNATLLMRCCNTDGLILKPDKPVTAIDDQIIESAFRDGSGARGEVWSTYSRVSGWIFGVIVGAAMKSGDSYNITPSSAGFHGLAASKVFADAPVPGITVVFDDQHPLTLRGCTNTNFCLYHTTPMFVLGHKELLLYGEISKWVPMSSRRVTSIELAGDDVIVRLTGAVREVVEFWFSLDGNVRKVNCTLPEFGKARLSIKQSKCV